MTVSCLADFPADVILMSAGIKGVKSVASGKYRISEAANFGGTYWATHLVRDPRDEFGVQFSGASGLRIAEKYRHQLAMAEFIDRDHGKANGKATFVRTIVQLANGGPNVAAIQEAKADLDRIFSVPPPSIQAGGSTTTPRKSFVEAFRGSLPFFVDLELPPRDAEPMREIDL